MLREEGLPLPGGRAPVLSGKVALITGAASGIGRATAVTFARQGARIGLLDVNQAALDSAAAEINAAAMASLPLSLRRAPVEGGKRGSGGEGIALPLNVDVRDPDGTAAAVDQLVERWGRLDILFANAGINGVWAPVADITPDEYDQTLDINLKGTFLSITASLPALRQQGGSIVITSSVNGTRIFSNSGGSVYAASKAAQLALGKMLAVELARDRIRVNVICPGSVKTNISENTIRRNQEGLRYPMHFPLGVVPLTDGAPASADQVASVVLFLVSDMASHVTGEEIFIDGAQSLLRG